MFMLRVKLVLFLMAAITAHKGALAQSAVDDCIKGVDARSPTATDFGITVADVPGADALAATCEAAEQQATQSNSLKLAVAQALIWAKRDDAALIRLEQLIGQEQGAANLASALCASGRGSARVVETTCDWMAAHPPSNPAIAMAAGTRLLQEKQGGAALSAIGVAAQAGDQDAIKAASDFCLAFDPNNLTAITQSNAAFAKLDPAFVAALTCEAAFTSLPTDSPNWGDSGFNFVTAMTYFDDYASAGGALYDLSRAQDTAIAGQAIDVAVNLCVALAGDPNDPAVGSLGVEDHEIIVERAQPICEVAAYTAPGEPSLHYNLARVYALQGDQASADAAFAEAQRLGYALATGQGPNNGGAATLAQGPAGQFAFEDFNRETWIRAFHAGDMATLRAERTPVLIYLQALLEPLESPTAYFRAPGIDLAKDARLLPHLNMKIASDPEFMGETASIGLGALTNLFIGLADERKRQQASGEFNPAKEIAAANRGMMSGTLPFAVLKREGNQDGIRLLEAVFNNSPSDFKAIYEGIQKFAYSL